MRLLIISLLISTIVLVPGCQKSSELESVMPPEVTVRKLQKRTERFTFEQVQGMFCMQNSLQAPPAGYVPQMQGIWNYAEVLVQIKKGAVVTEVYVFDNEDAYLIAECGCSQQLLTFSTADPCETITFCEGNGNSCSGGGGGASTGITIVICLN